MFPLLPGSRSVHYALFVLPFHPPRPDWESGRRLGLKLGPGARPPSQLAALNFILVQCAQEMSVQSDVVELIRKCTFANEG